MDIFADCPDGKKLFVSETSSHFFFIPYHGMQPTTAAKRVLLIVALSLAVVQGRRGVKRSRRRKSSGSPVFGADCFPAGSECHRDSDCCSSPGDEPFRYELVCYRGSSSKISGSRKSRKSGKRSGTCYPDWGYGGSGFLKPGEWKKVYPLCAGGERQG
jgi:hypothetical protein